MRCPLQNLVAASLLLATAALPSYVHKNDTLAVIWTGAALDAIIAVKPAPTVAARAVAIVATCNFDAWATFQPNARRVHYSGPRQPKKGRHPVARREALSFAAFFCLTDLFPTQTAVFSALLSELGYDPADSAADADQAATVRGGKKGMPAALVGTRVGQAVMAARRGDGSNQLGTYLGSTGPYSDYDDPASGYTHYEPVNSATELVDYKRYQPLIIGGVTQTPLTPHWLRVAPFHGARRILAKPLDFSDESFAKMMEDVLAVSAALDDRKKSMAKYWADGPGSIQPPGHWMTIGFFVSRRDKHSLGSDIKLLFALGNSLMDAGIAAWDSKRVYDSGRPVTAIRHVYAGKTVTAFSGPYLGVGKIDGADWAPYQPVTVVTPAFQEYVSGHAAFSWAAAVILRLATGSDAFGGSAVVLAGSSLVEPGAVPATDVNFFWPKFSDAAEEASISRIYGGIHFTPAIEEGKVLGEKVGEAVWRKAREYF